MKKNTKTKDKVVKSVLIAYKSIPQYRVDFFNRLKIELEKNNIKLEIAYGKSINIERNDENHLNWAIYRENKIISFLGLALYWQPISNLIKGKDLIIVEQANSLLINYYLIFLKSFGKIKLGFWGHGRNRQGNMKSLSNYFKILLLKKCDHWFAYTESVEQYLVMNGYNQKKISIVNNSFDTLGLQTAYKKLTPDDLLIIENELGICSNDHVAIYCGALYKEKRLDFLIDSAIKIKEKDDKFHLLIIGSGPDINMVEDFSSNYKWVHYLGSKFNDDKVIYFKLAKIFLMPGAVGLAVLDSFALETPMILPKIDIHGPEVDYLIDKVNCVMTEDDVNDIAYQAISLFNQKDKINELIVGCKRSANEITLENMVAKFTNGIITCLK